MPIQMVMNRCKNASESLRTWRRQVSIAALMGLVGKSRHFIMLIDAAVSLGRLPSQRLHALFIQPFIAVAVAATTLVISTVPASELLSASPAGLQERLLQIPLKTEATLDPLYIAAIKLNFSQETSRNATQELPAIALSRDENAADQIENEGVSSAACSPEYALEYLEKILEIYKRTLRWSGHYQLLSHEESLIKLSQHFDEGASLQQLCHAWRQCHVRYLMKLEVTGSTPSPGQANRYSCMMELLDTAKAQWKRPPKLELTGHLATDRMRVYRHVDKVNALLKGSAPFAQSRALCAITTPSESSTSGYRSKVIECDLDGNNEVILKECDALIVSPTRFPVPNIGRDHPRGTLSEMEALLYVSYQHGQPRIYLSAAHKGSALVPSHTVPITNLPGNQLSPSVARKIDRHGRQIACVAFISDAEGNPDLWIQEIDLRTLKASKPYCYFSDLGATQASPVWSPDGKQLALVSSKDGRPRIYILPAPELGERCAIKSPRQTLKMVARKGRESTCPAWSPEGKRLVYCVKNGGDRQLWMVNIVTGKEEALTSCPGNKENPSFASDGVHIVFNMDFGASSDLYMLDIHTRRMHRLTSLKGDVRFPSLSIAANEP